MQSTVHFFFFISHHVVAQVIKCKFIVRSVRNITVVSDLFFFFGVIAVLYGVLMHVIRPKNGEVNFVVTVLEHGEKNAVARISYLLTRVSAAGDKHCTKIIAVDNGITPEQYKAVLTAFASESSVILCPRRSLDAAIFGTEEK